MGKTFQCLKNLVIPPSVSEPFSQSWIKKVAAILETKLIMVLSLPIIMCGMQQNPQSDGGVESHRGHLSGDNQHS